MTLEELMMNRPTGPAVSPNLTWWTKVIMVIEKHGIVNWKIVR